MVVVGAFKAKLGGSGGDRRRLQEGITDSDCIPKPPTDLAQLATAKVESDSEL
jgi:hypothetical protein